MKERPRPKKRNARLMTIDSSPQIEATYNIGVARKLIMEWMFMPKSKMIISRLMNLGIFDMPLRVISEARDMQRRRIPITVLIKLLFSTISKSFKGYRPIV